MEALANIVPTVVPILVDYYAQRDNFVIDLIQQKTKWGEFNRRSKDSYVEGQKQLMAAAQQIYANLQRSHEAELANRQALHRGKTHSNHGSTATAPPRSESAPRWVPPSACDGPRNSRDAGDHPPVPPEI